jgi:hypothetical protein
MSMSEAAFQTCVMDLARWTGWKVFHPRTVKTDGGRHLTAYQGDRGFPDLVLAHKQRGVLFVELKTDKGRLDTHQEEWGRHLVAAQAEYYVWRPSDWEEIKKRLRGKQ